MSNPIIIGAVQAISRDAGVDSREVSIARTLREMAGWMGNKGNHTDHVVDACALLKGLTRVAKVYSAHTDVKPDFHRGKTLEFMASHVDFAIKTEGWSTGPVDDGDAVDVFRRLAAGADAARDEMSEDDPARGRYIALGSRFHAEVKLLSA